MPYDHLVHQYQPEQLKNLTEAFDLAWPTVVQARRIRNEDQAIWHRQRVANYILACLPAYKRAVLWFSGMQGDKQRGIDQLMRAGRGAYYLGPYAKILLALALLREKRGREASQCMQELTAEFPQSPLFARERAKIDKLAAAK